MSVSSRPASWSGFTLVELLVVIAIVVIVSAATIPAIIPALENRRVSEAARVFQAALAGARDSAIRANAPRGIRLLPDPVFFPATPTNAFGYRYDTTSAFASNSYVPIETGPPYSEGVVEFVFPGDSDYLAGFITLREVKVDPVTGLPNPPASWYWNIRVGEQLRIGGEGLPYTIQGPLTIPPGLNTTTPQDSNPDGFINRGRAGPATMGIAAPAQILRLTNGLDDNGNGFTDEGADGLDNNGDTIIDNNLEYEVEAVHSADIASLNSANYPYYTIERRPVPAQGSRVTTLPGGVVIDLTTWNFPLLLSPNTAPSERSRLPVDPLTGYVDILLAPNGQVIPTQPGLVLAGRGTIPFYHFWLTDRGDVYEPAAMTSQPNTLKQTRTYYLPMLEGTPYVSNDDTRVLEGERRLVTIHTRTGMIVTNPVEAMDPTLPDFPYLDAQKGEREAR